jgi:hypothetical protein
VGRGGGKLRGSAAAGLGQSRWGITRRRGDSELHSTEGEERGRGGREESELRVLCVVRVGVKREWGKGAAGA